MADMAKGGAATQTPQQGQQSQQRNASSSQGMQQRTGQGLERWSGTPDLYSGGPFEFMRRMSDEMDRVFDRIFDDFGFPRSLSPSRRFGSSQALTQGTWSPRIEAFQQGDQFIVRAELPGLKKDDVHVNITEEAITIEGQRRHQQTEEREGFYHSERSYGSFYRAIPLPNGAIPDSADASFKDGILEIKLKTPPAEVSRGRRVEIK